MKNGKESFYGIADLKYDIKAGIFALLGIGADREYNAAVLAALPAVLRRKPSERGARAGKPLIGGSRQHAGTNPAAAEVADPERALEVERAAPTIQFQHPGKTQGAAPTPSQTAFSP